MRFREYSTWAHINAAFWIAAFLFLWLKVECTFMNTEITSPDFDGLPPEDVSALRNTLFRIYFPFLGMVIAQTAQLFLRGNVQNRNASAPITAITILFTITVNIIVILWFCSFVGNPDAKLSSFLLNIQNALMSGVLFVIAIILNIFNFSGWHLANVQAQQ